MVISVFPDVSQGFARYEQSRRARLQDQALRTQNNMMQRRQAAFRDMLGGLEGRELQMAEVMGPDYVMYAAERDATQQAAAAEAAEAERARRFEFLVEEGQRLADARAAAGDSFDETSWLRDSTIRASSAGLQIQDPEAYQSRVRTWGSGFTPDADEQSTTEFERLLATLDPTEQDRLRRERARYLAGTTSRPGSGGPSFVMDYDEEGRPVVRFGPDAAASTYSGTATRAGQTRSEGLEGAGRVDRARQYVGNIWSLPAQAFGPGGRALEAGVRAAEAAAGVSGIVESIIGGNTSGLSQSAVEGANAAFERATGMTLQQYAQLRSEGTFLVGQLLPVVTGDTRFTEMERMITEMASGVRNLDDIFGSQSAARGASLATYGALLQGQAIRAIRAGAPPPYAALSEYTADGEVSESAESAINEFVADLIADGMSPDDAASAARRMVPIYADHLRHISNFNDAVLADMIRRLEGGQ